MLQGGSSNIHFKGRRMGCLNLWIARKQQRTDKKKKQTQLEYMSGCAGRQQKTKRRSRCGWSTCLWMCGRQQKSDKKRRGQSEYISVGAVGVWEHGGNSSIGQDEEEEAVGVYV